jgi:site-specific DNA recombinase
MTRTTVKSTSQSATTAIYTRISEDGERDRKGVTRQLDDCLALAKRNGWKLAAEPFVDNDVSAFSGKVRPAYTQLLARVRAGEIGRVVVWHMDRLYRRPRELEDLIDLAEAGQLEVACVNGSRYDLSDSDGQLNARMLVNVATKSSQDAGRRQKRKQAELRKAGLYTGGPRPFGWKANGTKGKLVAHPKEARILLRAMADVLAGRSLNDIAREWSDAKWKMPKKGKDGKPLKPVVMESVQGIHGRAWGGNDISRALTMPRHAGLVVHQGEIVGTGKWKPLVDRARWEQVCAAVNSRSRFAGLPRRRSMLTGVVICGACGAPMTRSSVGNRIRVWRCHVGPRRIGCGKLSIHADLLEPIVVEATMQYVDTVDLAALVSKQDSRSPDLAQAARELGALDRREDEVGSLLASGRISGRMAEKASGEIEGQRKQLRNVLAREAKRNALAPYARRPGALRAAWTSLTIDQQRAIISESLRKVTILTARPGRRFDATRIVIGDLSRGLSRGTP